MRGGANGARIRLAPQKDWEANQPAELAKVLKVLEGIQAEFNKAAAGGKQVSLADLIVLAGCAGIEKAAKNVGVEVTVPFSPGRMDASQEQTDVEAFAVLEPIADGSAITRRPSTQSVQRNCWWTRRTADADTAGDDSSHRRHACPEHQRRQTKYGVFTDRPEALSNDFFVNLLDMGTTWRQAPPTRTCSKQ